MTGPRPGPPPHPLPVPGAAPRIAPPLSSTPAEASGDAYIRRAGKTLILALYAALRAIRLYPLENAAVVKSADDLAALCKDLLAR